MDLDLELKPANGILRIDRRTFLCGLASALGTAVPALASTETRPALQLEAQAAAFALRPGQPDTPIVAVATPSSRGPLRFKRGDVLDLQLGNATKAPIALDWRGLDDAPAIEPLLALPPLKPQARQNLVVPLRQAGTFLCDLRLLGNGQPPPSATRALVVDEADGAAVVDRDEVLLFEDWRLRPDGTAIAPGTDPDGTAGIVTVNGKRALDVNARSNERFRFRFINSFQRNVIAVKIENTDVRVMALDSQPSEPFLARNGAVVLAPGARADVFVDITLAAGATIPILLHDGTEARQIGRLLVANEAPVRNALLPPAPALPSNDLPAKLDLRNALRVNLALNGPRADWATPTAFSASAAPAFRAKAGRTVVLALINAADRTTVFHLHGHHFRLLDRLDDGWKPFWLDTLAVEPGQTQRIAFAAEHAGRWLMETAATAWAAPRLLRWYDVE